MGALAIAQLLMTLAPIVIEKAPGIIDAIKAIGKDLTPEEEAAFNVSWATMRAQLNAANVAWENATQGR